MYKHHDAKFHEEILALTKMLAANFRLRCSKRIRLSKWLWTNKFEVAILIRYTGIMHSLQVVLQDSVNNVGDRIMLFHLPSLARLGRVLSRHFETVKWSKKLTRCRHRKVHLLHNRSWTNHPICSVLFYCSR